MSKLLKKRHKHYRTALLIVIIALVFSLLAVIISYFILANSSNNIINSEINKYISETSASLENSFKQRIEHTFNDLESVSLSYINMNMNNDSNKDVRVFQHRAEAFGLNFYAFISPDGKAVSSDGKNYDFSSIKKIDKAFEGEKITISVNPSTIGADAKDSSLMFAAPIYDNNSIKGVIVTVVNSKWADSIMTKYTSNNKVYFNIIKSDGEIIYIADNPNTLNASNKNNYSYTDNIFDLLQNYAVIANDVSVSDIEKASEEGNPVIVHFSFQGDDKYCTARIVPISDTDMRLWIVVMESSIRNGFESLLDNLFMVRMFNVLLFTGLIIFLFFSYKRSLRISFVDPVTQGFSLNYFEREVVKMIKKSEPGSYMFITFNMTDFKVFNDMYGIEQSDRILRHIYTTILNFIEPDEMITRTRSDHFNMLVHSRSDERIISDIDYLTRKINKFNDDIEQKHFLNFLIGIYRITDNTMPLINIRDKANIARDNVNLKNKERFFAYSIYKDDDIHTLHRKMNINNRMNDAIANHDFLVYMQPKINILSGNTVGVEVLVRWEDSEMGFMNPGEFIPIFEENGFITILDLYMFENVCQCLRKWIDAGIKPVPVSVNLSRVHLKNDDFLVPFIKLREKYDVPAPLIEIELTESMLQDYPTTLSAAVDKIHDAGFLCSIDDFGSEYSSLKILSKLNVDIVKLDKGFLLNQHSDPTKEKIIIHDLVNMLHNLGIVVCCEGVETEKHFEFLTEILCDKGQGFLFSRPVPAEEFEMSFFGRDISKINHKHYESRRP